MDATVLRLALQFGNGTHLEEEQHTGIGRFGMGLPSSSVSQCQKVEVWTWQDGVENALYSYLDLDEIKSQEINVVPVPQVKVRFSYAKEEARQASGNKNPGDLPHGKHAAKNIGVSMVRAGRELDLDVTVHFPLLKKQNSKPNNSHSSNLMYAMNHGWTEQR